MRFRERIEHKTLNAFGRGNLNGPYVEEDREEDESENDEDMTEEEFLLKITNAKKKFEDLVEKASTRYPNIRAFKLEIKQVEETEVVEKHTVEKQMRNEIVDDQEANTKEVNCEGHKDDGEDEMHHDF